MIAKEGRVILFILLAISFPIGVYSHASNNQYLTFLYYLFGIVFLFTLYFFRDPFRKVNNNPSFFVSPADGRILSISVVNDNDIGPSSHVISIFLNLFDVHVNRYPFDGIIEQVERKNGKFIAAFNHGAADVNEQVITTIAYHSSKYKIKQIAGLIARRILCYARPNLKVMKGDRMGFIRFGSRTDLVVPSNITICVKEGDKVKGGETVLAKI